MLNSGIIQAKLRIGQPNDRYEQEADRVADQVMRMPESSNSISPMANGGGGKLVQRQGGDEELQEQPEEKEELQAKPISAQITPLVQRQEEDEELQTKHVIQREVEDEESDQALPIQRQTTDEEEEVQAKPTIQRKVDEEEEPAQANFIQRQEEEDESVQTKHADDSQVQRKVSEDMLPPEAKREVELAKVKRDSKVPEDEDLQQMPIRRQGISGEAEGGASMASAAAQAISTKGPGEPMQNSTRDALESRMGMDLSDVRVHSDSTAQEAAKNLNARAFTNKRDIWLGAGQSQDNLSLMAHEAAHVAQQSGDVQRRVVQRAGENPETIPTTTTSAQSGSQTNTLGTDTQPVGNLQTGLENGDTITFQSITIPRFKNILHRGELYQAHSPLKRRKGATVVRSGEHATNQRTKWKDNLNKAQIVTVLNKKLVKAHAGEEPTDQTPVWEVALGKQYQYFFGKVDDVAREMTTPYWYGGSKKAHFKRFDVDHIVELQLANWPGEPWANELTNMELLDNKKNQKSGGYVRGSIEGKIKTFLKLNRGIKKPGQADVRDIKTKYNLIFNKAVGSGGSSVTKNDYWSQKQIESGDHLGPVKGASASEIGGSSFVRIFSREVGGASRKFNWSGSKGAQKTNSNERGWLKPFVTTEKSFNTEAEVAQDKHFGYVKVKIPANHKVFQETEEQTVSISRVLDARYGGMIDRKAVMSELRKVKIKHASPISFANIDLDPVTGFNAHGNLLPSIPLLDNLDIGLDLKGGELVIFKEFTLDEFKDKIPKPFELKALTLKIFYSTGKGFGFDGQADFDIEKVGEGQLKGGFSTGKGISLAGNFSFAKSLFNPAEVGFAYENGNWSANGKLGIKDGKVTGIKSAQMMASYKDKVFSATGTVEPQIPGVKSGGFDVKYSEEEGLIIGGKLDLSEDIPRVKGGSVDAKVTQREDGKYKVEAGGRADLDIPGVDASVDVKYDDGMFLAKGTVGYKKGMLEGSITAGATNMAVSEDGVVLPGEPGKKLQPFGRGTASVKIAPWLKGTIGIKLKPNGEVEVTGEVGLPSSLEIFKKRPYKKNIFETPSIDIPILGFVVPVIKKRVGVFATIKGGMDAEASIGPGELTDLSLSITYNPQREEDTLVHGKASLQIPAKAGLSLYVKGGIGAGIPIVSAEAGLKVTGGLGIEGTATAAVEVDWTPAKGLVLDANANIYAEPKFKFGIDAYALVEVELPWPFDDRTLYDETWNLANFEYGSGLRFGLLFPFHYEEGKTPDIALDDIEFQAPKIGVKDVISGIVKQII